MSSLHGFLIEKNLKGEYREREKSNEIQPDLNSSHSSHPPKVMNRLYEGNEEHLEWEMNPVGLSS